MAPLELIIALVALAALVAYALLGGADFGGGVWNLLARGPRAEAQRAAIAHAMGPVWEANHVWLIFLIVVSFICFPVAHAALSVALFVPFHLALVGIVLRGSAFVFRAYGGGAGPSPRWTRVFGIASSITPFLLGMCLAAISGGHLRTEGSRVLSDPFSPWLSPLAWALGAFSLAICAYLAAVYLTLETEGELREDFRRRALAAGVVTAVLAAATLGVAWVDAPRLFGALAAPRSIPLLAAGFLLGAVAAGCVWTRRFGLARWLSGTVVALFVLGWAGAQYPFLVYPDLTLSGAAAPRESIAFVLWSLVPGGLILVPSLALLFRVFKGAPPHPDTG